jgi:DNA-binding transcriptional LysR family regulator
MELRHLRYFIAVAEELHFSRAAARLHIAQPPLSQQIKQLEAELHTQLLWRTKRRVELTAAGEAFLEEARRTLAQADHAAWVAQSTAAGDTGQVQVGFIESALPRFLPRLLRSFRERHPKVQVVLQGLTSGQQVEALKRAEIQVAVLRPTRAGAQVAFHEIGTEGLLVAMPADHRLAELETVPVEELEHEGWVLFPRLLSPGLHDHLVGICRKAGFVPRVVHEAREGRTIVGMVGAGMGVALVAESMRNLGGLEVICRPLAASDARIPMCVAWRRDERARVVRSFIEIAKAQSY